MSEAQPDPVVDDVVRFEDLPVGSSATRCVVVRWSDGTQGQALAWYDDEIPDLRRRSGNDQIMWPSSRRVGADEDFCLSRVPTVPLKRRHTALRALAAAVGTARDVAGYVVKLARQHTAVVTSRAQRCSPVLSL
jgi:hypothetical protein